MATQKQISNIVNVTTCHPVTGTRSCYTGTTRQYLDPRYAFLLSTSLVGWIGLLIIISLLLVRRLYTKATKRGPTLGMLSI